MAMSKRPKLTVVSAREMPFEELVLEADRIVEQYAAPDGMETEPERMERLSRSIDELPDVYRWFLSLESYFDHWTDAMADMHGRNANEYKAMRQRRDAMKNAASFAKRRYEGSSRLVTMILGQDPEQMPRGR